MGLLGLIHVLPLFQVGGGCADNAGERRPQVMGNGPEKVCPHLLLLRLHQHVFPLIGKLDLFFQMSSQGAGQGRDDGHAQKSHWVAV